MDKSKLDLLIQEAARQQQQELSWVGNLYRQRLKELQESNEKYTQWLNNSEAQGARGSETT
jgi:hypothetical protein